jgi:SAM-dependent methyltransferase
MTAADRWREQLQARRIPEDVLSAAPESPYGYPTELFRTRADRSRASSRLTPTTHRALEALPDKGGVLDIGCGAGATSLPLAERMGHVVGVDEQLDMLEAFKNSAAAAGVDAQTVHGRWPAVAESVPTGDVVVCGHVLYNEPEAVPFLRAMDAHALRRVVIELTGSHPIQWMADLWRRFHGLRWPQGPTAADARAVIEDIGWRVRREVHEPRGDRGAGGFERRQDAVALVRRRLCLPPDRDDEVASALGPMLRERGGLWSAGPPEQTVVTLWWDVAADS